MKTFDEELKEILDNLHDQGQWEIEGIAEEDKEEAIKDMKQLIKKYQPEQYIVKDTESDNEVSFGDGFHQALADSDKAYNLSGDKDGK